VKIETVKKYKEFNDYTEYKKGQKIRCVSDEVMVSIRERILYQGIDISVKKDKESGTWVIEVIDDHFKRGKVFRTGGQYGDIPGMKFAKRLEELGYNVVLRYMEGENYGFKYGTWYRKNTCGTLVDVHEVVVKSRKRKK
jgi:hypothetical protein